MRDRSRRGRLGCRIGALVVSVVLLGSCASAGSNSADRSVVVWDGANWMRDLAPRLGERPLSELVIPGTHDSGTFSFSLDGLRIAERQNDTQTAQFQGLPDEFVLGTQVTQTQTWTEQLDAGIRYFDFRVVCESDGLFIVHTYRGQPVDRALSEIAAWMRAHPKEVLFLDVQKNYGCTEMTVSPDGRPQLGNDVLTRMVDDAFGSSLARRPPSSDASTTLNSLIEAGTNVVPFLIDTGYAMKSDVWWLRAWNTLPEGAGMTNVWEPIITMPEMFAALRDAGPQFSSRQQSQLLLASVATSPMFPRETGIANWYRDWRNGSQHGSLREFIVAEVLPTMPQMVESLAEAGYNVLSTDFYERGQWSQGTFAQMVAERNLASS